MGESWSHSFDDRARDPEIGRWRGELKNRHHVREFGADPKSIPIDAAIAQWVVDVESARSRQFRRRLARAGYAVLGALLLFAVYAVYAYRSPGHRHHYLSIMLGYHDPIIFNSSPNGDYEIARAIDSYATLRGETRLSDEVRGTQKSFDLLANNAQYIRKDQEANFIDIIHRGGAIRILLSDYTDANRQNYDAFCRAIGESIDETRGGSIAVAEELRHLKRQFDSDKGQYPGHMDFRWNMQPILYTMWVRDWDQSNGMGHIGLNFYQGQTSFPDFRVSALDSDRTLRNMHLEFETAWKNARADL